MSANALAEYPNDVIEATPLDVEEVVATASFSCNTLMAWSNKKTEQVLSAQAKAAFDMVVAYMQRGDILTKQAQIELFMLHAGVFIG